MCGRARCTLRADDISRACHRHGRSLLSIDMDRYRPSYNVSPGWNVPVVRRGDGSTTDDDVVLQCMKWGLIPGFTKKTEKPDHYRMFNARSESICEKSSFRRLVPNNRCLVAMEGFYEWKKDGSKKQPYHIHFKDNRPLVFAALYDSWKNSEDRMPVILGDEGTIDAWLASSTSKFDTVLKPYEGPDLAWYPVNPAMGKPSFEGPECIKEIKLKSEETKPISKFFAKRGLDKESNLEVGRSVEQPANPSQPKHLKEEAQTEDRQGNTTASQVKSLKEEPETEESQETLTSANVKEESKEEDSRRTTKLCQLGTLKEEPAPEDSHIKKGDAESKAVEVAPSQEGTLGSPIKRAYESTAGNEPSSGQTEKLCTHRVKKKGKIETGDDKQPTLFSYFGKR